MSKLIDSLTEHIAEMPGIGPRQARRIVQFLLRTNQTYKQELSKMILELSQHVQQCSLCYRYDETQKGSLCSLCANLERDDALLVVVEKDVDVEAVEASGIFSGRYFVLGGLMHLARQRKNSSSLRTRELQKRISHADGVNEVVLAFATTPEGDFTAKEVQKFLKEKVPTLKVSMLGRGLSLGAEIEYADQETLKNAFDGRH